jgi:hypothetical protein
MSKIETVAKAIQKHEGFFAPGETPKYPSGTLAWKNNNPGNLVFGELARAFGAETYYEHPRTKHKFAIFPSYEKGFGALCRLIENACTGKSAIYKPDWTILQFFTKYSPIRDKAGNITPNVPYASAVAKELGVSIATRIGSLIEQTTDLAEYAVYSQRDPRWKDTKLGFGQTTIGSHGCFLTALSMVVKQPPNVVNAILRRASAFNQDLIISDKAAQALGLQYDGRDYNIDNMPAYSPSIKEVDMSPAPGKQQHFVLRVIRGEEKYIIDPWTGEQRRINYYPFVSYRLFKKLT